MIEGVWTGRRGGMMSEEKLRALLAEARECVRVNCPCCGKANCPEGSEPELSQRIDAALAEPVADYDMDADLRLHKEDRLRLRAENLRLERERDEARAEVEHWKGAAKEHAESLAESRAEVERLRSLKPIGTYSLDWNHEQERQNTARAAYQRGAEAMREAAAKMANDAAVFSDGPKAYMAEWLTREISALPVLVSICGACGRHDQPHDPCDCAGEDEK